MAMKWGEGEVNQLLRPHRHLALTGATTPHSLSRTRSKHSLPHLTTGRQDRVTCPSCAARFAHVLTTSPLQPVTCPENVAIAVRAAHTSSRPPGSLRPRVAAGLEVDNPPKHNGAVLMVTVVHPLF